MSKITVNEFEGGAQAAREARRGATRREFLTGAGAALGAMSAAAMLPGAPGLLGAALPRAAAAQADAGSKPVLIDIHHHFGSPGWVDEIFNKRGVGNATMHAWTPEKSLEEMDKSGTTVAMLSYTRPGVYFSPSASDMETTRRLARDMNEYGAKLMADHPKRFGLFAVLPLPDVDASLKEIEYAFDKLKADGVGVMSNFDNIYLGDPKIAPVMDELNRRKAVLFEHPVREDRDNPLNGVELVTETTRSIHSVLYNGTVARCPDIKFVWSHGGGTLPMAVSRFAIPQGRLPKGTMYEVQKMYYDCAGIVTTYQLAAVKALVPLPHFLFGTDFPLGGPNGISGTDKGLRDNGGFSAGELRAIEHDNVLEVVPRLKTT